MVTYLFILFALLSIASAIGVVLNKSAVNSALFLVVNLVALAGIYLLLQAQFLAVIQLLVYAGAIMVLFLFVIMLLNLDNEENIFNKFRFRYGVAFIVGIVILAQLLYSLGSWTDTLPAVSPKMAQVGTVQAVGNVLFTHYLLPFEVTAILLTAAVVGALLVAQRKIQTKE
ncbi:MAG TPA: NADH-quinone oxidoreductase subunit J [Balneolales bacterium]|nr:NADH-quinone oxidoreductase subunit J [Balneolales bacterium]